MGSFAWWLAGLAAVSVPVLIHLLHRQRTQPVLWGAMLFLRMSVLQQKRRKRVENWLLMLLRLALMALIAFLLARPLLPGGSAVAGLGGRPAADIGVVLDHSLSTRWQAGDRTVYEQAVATLAQLGGPDALKPSDTISVVLAEKTPRKLTPVPVPRDALPGLLNTLRNQKPGATRASIPEAVQAVREVVNRGRNSRKIVLVLSDGQRTNWEPQSLEKWNAAVGQRVKGVESNLKVYDVPLVPAGERRANVAVADVRVEPRVVGQNRRATVRATVQNTGSAAVAASSAALWVNGKQVGTPQPVPALETRQSRTVAFEHEFAALNSNAVEVRLTAADGFDADNVAAASAFVLKAIPVLIVDGQPGGAEPADASNPAALDRFRGSAYLVSAMLADAKDVDAPAFISPTVVGYSDSSRLRDLTNGRMRRDVRLADGTKRSETVGLDDFAAVILNDVPRLDAALANRLPDYARTGHGVWCILGRRTEPTLIRDQIAGGNLFRMGLNDGQEPAEKPVAIDVRNPQYEVLAPFAAPERNVLTGMTTLRWWSVKPLEGDAQVPLATATGDPLILEHAIGSAGGRVIVWTSPVDGTSGWNNWPSMKAFAPMVNLTAYRLAGGLTKGQEARVDSGKALVWASPVIQEKPAGGSGGPGGRTLVFPDGAVSPPVAWAEVTTPSGQKSRARPVTRDGRQWAFFGDTFEPGRYEVRFDQSNLPPVYYGVGIDAAELDETTLSDDDRKWLTADEHKFVERALEPKDLAATLSGGDRKGTELWPVLAAGLLGVLLFETFMTYRVMRRQAGPAAGMVPAPRAA